MSYTPNQYSEASLDNTTTTPLGSGATYTGTGDLSDFPDVMVVCKTDNTGTLYFDFSPDGTNWDSTFPPLGFKVSNGINEFHTAVKGPRYFRVRLVNDSGAQTYLRLYTYMGVFRQGNIPINATVGQDADAIITRPTNWHYECALGRIGDTKTWNKWGYNSDIDSAASETIWSVGGDFTRLTSAETLDVSSSNAADSSASTGARSIVIYGVDANYLEQIEVVTMNGTTPVTTAGTWLGVNRMSVYSTGSGDENAGDITAEATTAATVQAEIPAGKGSTQHAFFFVQSNHTALMDWLLLNVIKTSGGSSPTVIVSCWVTSLVSGARYEVLEYNMDIANENHVELKPSQPFVIGEKSLIEFRLETDTNNTEAHCRFSLIEEGM